jgi:soluble lytic murein transglycosylase
MKILGSKLPEITTTAIASLILTLVLGISADGATAQSKRTLAPAPTSAAGPTDSTADAPGASSGAAAADASDGPAAETAADETAADAASGAESAAADGLSAPGLASAVDQAFTAARKAMLANDLERFDQAILVIPRDHVLYSYVDYWRLRIRFRARRLEALTGDADPAARAFLERHSGTLAADLLRRDWMLALGRRADWQLFDEQYPQWQLRDEISPDCYAQLSRLSRLAPGQPLSATARKAVNDLLMRPEILTRACADLFESLAAAGMLKPQEIRSRFLFALEANATSDIRFAASLLGAALNEKGLEQALRRPAVALKTPQSRDLLLIAIIRLARTDADAAALHLRRAGNDLSAEDRRFAWSQVAAAGMRRLAPDSHAWAREALGARASDQTKGWLARAALRQQDWDMVRTIILSMSDEERSDATWIYWLGRARKAQGHPREAEKLLASLTSRHDFYGKLANEELDRQLTVPSRPMLPPPASVAAFDDNPGVARALAFYSLGMRFEGNREWNFQMRNRSDDELRAAAHWAMQRKLLDRAINTDERIASNADFTLRFPTPFSEQLIPITREHDVDAAWVYGLIRQESRFIMDARSQVGASGLMQIMPATARWIAKKMGRREFNMRELNDLQTNLEFGTFYLKQALTDLDGSAVLASAGYNAGPGRARNWRNALSAPLEGAIFAEIIPFTETRGYVKNVLSNATDYAGIFSGKPQSLKARLGTIEPKQPG